MPNFLDGLPKEKVQLLYILSAAKAELTELQGILLDFESGSFREALDGAQKQVDGSLEQVRQADDRVLDICAKTYKLMLAFR